MEIHFEKSTMISILEKNGFEVKKVTLSRLSKFSGPIEKWIEFEMDAPHKDGKALIPYDEEYCINKGPFFLLELQVEKLISEKMFELLTV